MFGVLRVLRILPSIGTAAVLLGVILTGCSSSNTVATTGADGAPAVSASETEARLRSAADRWNGAPYQYGGTSKRGVDCSALVQAVYGNEFQLSLPRSTDEQADVGTRISRSTLRPGDLVFFRTGWKQDHVGIYLSDGEFLHASTSEGVTVSRLDRSYWQNHWWQARRLIPEAADTSSTSSDSLHRPESSNGVGW